MMPELEEKILAFIERGTGDFAGLLVQLHARQRQLCPAFDAFCSAHPHPAATWKELPALPLTAFRHTAIRCFPADETVRTFHTSGTTGEGHGQHHLRTLALYRAAALGGWDQAGLPRKPILCLLPHPEEAPHSSLSQMGAWLAPRENFFHGSWEALLARLAPAGPPATDREPVTLFGTALGFLDFFQWLDSRSLSLPPGSLAVETGGYKGARRQLSQTELHQHFQARLGLPPEAIHNEYGMTELSSQFYAVGPNSPHHGAPWVRGVVINPENGRECAEGETGILRLFDLANTGSCCALETRDLAIRRRNGFELLGRDPAALPRGCSRRADEILHL